MTRVDIRLLLHIIRESILPFTVEYYFSVSCRNFELFEEGCLLFWSAKLFSILNSKLPKHSSCTNGESVLYLHWLLCLFFLPCIKAYNHARYVDLYIVEFHFVKSVLTLTVMWFQWQGSSSFVKINLKVFLLFLFKGFIFNYMYILGGYVHMCTVTQGGQEKAFSSMELDFQMVLSLSHLM